MSISRRSALTVLGIAAAPSVAVEAFAKPILTPSKVEGDRIVEMDYNGLHFGLAKQMSEAFRRLADDIDAGNTLPQKFSLHSSVSLQDYLLHTMTFEFALKS